MEKNDLMTFGLVGNGFLANIYLDVFKEHPKAKLLAVCNSDLPKEMIENRGIKYCQSYDDLIHQNHEIDSIIIASPFRYRGLHALTALQGGKNVLCEKPSATNLGDIEKLVKTAEIMEKVLMTPFPYNYDKGVRETLKNYKEEKNKQGKKIIKFYALACENIPENCDLECDQFHAGTGCLTNLGADFLNLLCRFLGPLKIVSSKLDGPDKCVSGTSASINLTFDNDAGKGILYSNSHFEKEIKKITFFTKGGEKIKIDLIDKSSLETALLHRKKALNHFINLVAEGKHRGEKALEIQKMICEIYQKQS